MPQRRALGPFRQDISPLERVVPEKLIPLGAAHHRRSEDVQDGEILAKQESKPWRTGERNASERERRSGEATATALLNGFCRVR